MKAANAKKSSTTSRTATQAANQPFFSKAGGGNFFASVNRAAVPSVQMKMAVNKPGDTFEQEADKMAGKVMRMSTPAASEPEEKVQRQEEEKLQKQDDKEIQKAEMPEEQVQKQEKEEIQKADLPEEQVQKQEKEEIQKADLPEEQVQKQEKEEIQKAEQPEEQVQKQEQEEIQKAEMPEEQVQKQEDEEVQRAEADKEEVQRKGNGAPAVNAGTQSAIRSKTTGGQPLSGDVRSFMEPRFNADFSNVRVHNDAEAANLSKQLGAKAFTYQNHIFFAKDQYQPGTSEGKELLAHELTHTVQQSGRANKSLAKSEVSNTVQLAKKNSPSSSKKKSKEKLLADGSIVGSNVILTNFPLKRYVFNGKTIDAPGNLVKNNKILKINTRKTKQGTVWKRMVKENVKKSIESRMKNEKLTGNVVLKREKEFKLIGTPADFSKSNLLLIPRWNHKGKKVIHEIEHKVDALIAGNKKADSPENLMLLDKGTNRAVGGGHVIGIVKRSVNQVLTENQNNSLKYNTFEELQANGKIIIEKGVNTDDVYPGSVWEQDDFNESTVNDKIHPLNKDLIEIVSGKVEEGQIILKINNNLGYVVRSNIKNKYIELKPDQVNKPKKIKAKIKPIFKERSKKPALKSNSVKEVDLEQDSKDGDIWRLKNLSNYYELLSVNHLSPLELDENSFDFNPLFGTQASGKVKSDIPLLREADILFEANQSNFTICAEIGTDYLSDKFPKPFSVDYSTFSISASTKRGLRVGGEIGFGIEKVGKGNVKAGIGKDGLSLEGSFDFDKKLFKGNKASIKVAYDKTNGWAMQGDLEIGKGTVKGINSGKITVAYAKDMFEATGTAEVAIKGVKDVTLGINFGEDTSEIEGEVKIEKLPGIKEGEGKLKIIKKGDNYDFSGSGKVTPDIPGLSTQADFTFHNDIFLVDTRVPYDKGRLKGTLNLGITNRAIDSEGSPTGEALPDYKVFGKSNLELKITDKLMATAGVNLLENGEIEVKGGIKLPQELEVVPQLLSVDDKPIITAPSVHIPLFGIPLGVTTIGIEAVITPKLKADVQVGPGTLVNVGAEVAYNPAHPDEMTITGNADFEFIAEAGITAGVDFGLSASAAVASLTGGIGLSAFIKAAAKQPVFHTDIKYSPKTGFELNGLVNAKVAAILGFEGDLFVKASAGGWGLEVSKTWESKLFKKEIDTGLQIGFEFPFSYKDGKSNVSFEKLKSNFTYPNLNDLTNKVREKIVDPLVDKF